LMNLHCGCNLEGKKFKSPKIFCVKFHYCRYNLREI
jgi:hypothetical protein